MLGETTMSDLVLHSFALGVAAGVVYMALGLLALLLMQALAEQALERLIGSRVHDVFVAWLGWPVVAVVVALVHRKVRRHRG